MELIIVQSINDFASLKKVLSKNSEILVFSDSVMIDLDQKGIKYKVIEDFYSSERYNQDASVFRDKVERFLTHLDKACENEVNFPYAYSGNEHYFLTWFDHLFYLERLIETLKNKYNKIYLFSTNEPKKILENHLNFSKFNSRYINGTISFALEKSFERTIQLIYDSINISFLKDKILPKKNIPIKYQIKNYFNRLQFFYYRKFQIKNINKKKKCSFKNKNVYIIQDGYELYPLKKYLPKFKYSNPATKLRQEIQSEKPEDTSNIFINDILKSFIDKNFFFLKKYLYVFINSYHIEIVGRANSFKKKFEIIIKKDKPILMLSSIGTRDVFDTICCFVANKYKIPLITFQHSGSASFYYNPYSKSLEYNTRVSKTLISQYKKDIYKSKNEFTKVLCMGSVKQYEDYHKVWYKKPTKDILFCLGSDLTTSFRQLLGNQSVNIKYKQSIDIISTAETSSLSIDVKLHPTGEKNSFECYRKIIKNNQYQNTNIIYGSFAESILNKYGLLILDTLGTAVIMHIMCLKVPIIIYNCDFEYYKLLIDKSALSDLQKRFYIAKNKVELIGFLERYKAGKLPSKWSEEIIDNYIFPLNKGNPGKNIAEYIENHILHG
jgi:hypothetical protein